MLASKNKKKFIGFILLTGLIIILTLNLFFIQSFLVGIALVIGLLLIMIFFYNPKIGLLLFLIIRPLVDNQGEIVNIPIFVNNLTINLSALLGILFISLTSLFLLKKGKQLKYKNWVVFSWLLFILLSIFSIFYSIDKFASFYEIIRIISIFLFFLTTLIIVKTEKDINLFINAILISALIPFVIAIFQLITGNGMAGTSVGLDSRLYGTFSHPNQFASYALIAFGLSWFGYQKKTADKKYLIAFLVSLLALIATFSRGAWLGLILLSLIIGIFKNFKMILILFLFLVILFFSSETVHKRIEDIYNPPATSSIYWRIERWTDNYQSFIKKPLLGHGSGTELKVYENDYGFYSNNAYTHNDLLKNAIELGVVGSLLYLILILTTTSTLLKNYFKSKESSVKIFTLVVLAIFIAEFIFSMTSNIFRGTATQWTLWSLVGACLALNLKRKTLH